MTVELLAIFSCKSFQQELSNKVLYYAVPFTITSEQVNTAIQKIRVFELDYCNMQDVGFSRLFNDLSGKGKELIYKYLFDQQIPIPPKGCHSPSLVTVLRETEWIQTNQWYAGSKEKIAEMYNGATDEPELRDFIDVIRFQDPTKDNQLISDIVDHKVKIELVKKNNQYSFDIVKIDNDTVVNGGEFLAVMSSYCEFIKSFKKRRDQKYNSDDFFIKLLSEIMIQDNIVSME